MPFCSSSASPVEETHSMHHLYQPRVFKMCDNDLYVLENESKQSELC